MLGFLEKGLVIIPSLAFFTGSIYDIKISLLSVELIFLNFTLLLVSLGETSNVGLPNPPFHISIGRRARAVLIMKNYILRTTF